MESENVNVLGYMVSMLAICFVMGLFAGLYSKFISIVIGTLSYPTYLALYGLQFVLAPGKSEKRRFFSFNIPKSGDSRLACHFLGSIVTLALYPLGEKVFLAATDLKYQAVFWQGVMEGTLIPILYLLFPLACLLIMYAISLQADIDTNSPMEKIESLSVPSLWKKVVK